MHGNSHKKKNKDIYLFILGMLSKPKEQLLRVAFSLIVLINRHNPFDTSQSISEEAVRAAENFVDLCLQHAAYLAGRGDIQEAILAMQPG